MTTFSVRVSDAAAERFDAAAEPQGGRSAMLRRLIESAASTRPDARPEGRAVRPVRLMIRLAAADGAAVAAEADAMGLRPSPWVAALVRRRVRGRPTFSHSDEVALLAVQSEVRRIGVNVNQIARALNTAVLEGKVLDLEVAYLEDLRRELRAHMLALREAFEGNLAYWDVEP